VDVQNGQVPGKKKPESDFVQDFKRFFIKFFSQNPPHWVIFLTIHFPQNEKDVQTDAFFQ
jgi:hypothetical protein